mgnify:CR=1 FL=1
MGEYMYNIGDYVTRNSYNNDIVFKIIGIENDIYYLKGMCIRLYADSYKDDLVLCEDYAEKDKFMPSIDEYRELNRNEYFYLPGRILHLDGDREYLEKCMSFYKKNKLKAYGFFMKENDMSLQLEELLNKYDIPGELFEIEITESLFVGDSDRARKFFNDLSNIGVGLALDDFGTGYSSLSYLTYLPAQKVKIDKSIVDNYLVEGKESFIQNIVYLVHDLGMKLTVEGVEQKWQYDKLKEMNCDYIQGYFFSKPMQAEAVPSFSVAI